MPPKTAVLYNADTGLCIIKRSDDAGTRGYGVAGGFYCIMEEKGVRRADADPCRDSDEEIKTFTYRRGDHRRGISDGRLFGPKAESSAR